MGLQVWDLETGRPLSILEGNARSMTACAVTPDGRRLVASGGWTLQVWDLETGRSLVTVETPRPTFSDEEGVDAFVNDGRRSLMNTACAVARDGRVVSASSDGTLSIWDLDTGRALAVLEGHADSVSACAVTPDSRHVVSASMDGTASAWSRQRETGR